MRPLVDVVVGPVAVAVDVDAVVAVVVSDVVVGVVVVAVVVVFVVGVAVHRIATRTPMWNAWVIRWQRWCSF